MTERSPVTFQTEMTPEGEQLLIPGVNTLSWIVLSIISVTVPYPSISASLRSFFRSG